MRIIIFNIFSLFLFNLITAQSNSAFDFQIEGNEFLQNENFISALKSYNKAIDLYKKEKNAPYMLAKCFYYKAYCKQNLEDYRGAIMEYNNAINEFGKISKEDDFYITSFYYRGICKSLINDLNGACNDLSISGELGYSKSYDIIKKICTEN
jgi:tetratricopeptide (TPR) repeat protein